jgi:hypothetical protein
MPDDSGEPAQVRYVPGPGLIVVSGSVVAALPSAAPSDLVDALWAASGKGQLAVARQLLEWDIETLPDLAVAFVGPDSVRVLLRGTGTARVGDDVRGARAALTWAEHVLPLDGLELALAEPVDGPTMPLAGGVVAGTGVRWVTTSSPTDTRTEPAPAPPIESIAVTRAAEGTPVASTPSVVADAQAQARLSETLRPEDVPLPAPLGAEEGEPRHTSEPAPVQPRHAAPEPAQEPGPSAEDSYDRLFGATEHVAQRSSTVQPAASVPAVDALPPWDPPVLDAVVPPVDPASVATPDGPPLSALITGVPMISEVPGAAVHPPVQPSQQISPPSSTSPTRVVTGVPLVGATPLSAPGAPGDHASDDMEGMTVSRMSVRAMRAGPQVHGVLCPRGHANPSGAVICRVCAVEVPPQSAVTLPRPTLGALVAVDVPDGAPDRIPLDSSMIIGRKPSVDGASGAVPQLVTVSSPDQDLSRNHLKIVLDGWHVLVTDMSSTNGTMVEVPGEAPERIHPQRPTMITPGTRITLAEVATYVYEVGP